MKLTVANNKMTHQNYLIRYTAAVAKRPKSYLIMLGVVSILACIAMFRFYINATIYLIPSDYPSRITEQKVKAIFDASGEQAIVAIEAYRGDIFNKNSLNTIAELTEKFEAISISTSEDLRYLRELDIAGNASHQIEKIISDGLQVNDIGDLRRLAEIAPEEISKKIDDIATRVRPVRKVRSLITAEDIREVDDVLYTGRFLQAMPESLAEISALKKSVLANPIYRNLLISDSGETRATTLMIELTIAEDDAPAMVKIHKAIIAIIDAQKTKDTLYLGGGPVLAVQIDQSVQMDTLKYFPFVIISISVLLFIFFRRKQAVYLPVAIAGITILWSVGAMVGMGISVNIITSVLPVFVMTIAVADAVHYLSKFYELREKMNAYDAVIATNTALLTPMLLTTITTIAGFLALAYSLFSQVQHFSVFTALGVLFAFFITITLLPAVLPLLAKNELEASSQSQAKMNIQWPTRIGLWLNRFVERFRFSALLAVVIIAVSLSPLIAKLQVDNHNMAAFSEDTRLRKDDAVLNQYFGGTIPLNIWFEAEDEGAFVRPEAVRAVDSINQRLLQHPEIGYTAAMPNLIKRLHQVFNPNHPYRLPDQMSPELIGQYLLLLESGEGKDLRITIDESRQNSRIFVLGHTDQASVWEQIISDTESYAKTVLPKDITIHFSGFADVMVKNTDEVVNGQIISISVAAVVILFIVTLLFKSSIMGVIAIAPLTFTLLINFSLMVANGVFLDIGTSLIIAIVFGVGVDYAIHYLSILTHKISQGYTPEAALNETAAFVSRPIIINSIVVASGLLALTLSDYAVIAKLGLLVSSTIFLCGFFTLFLVPLFIRIFKPRTIYAAPAYGQLVSESRG